MPVPPPIRTAAATQARQITLMLVPATILVLVAFVAARVVTSAVVSEWLDNLHWTIAYFTAMALGWLGVKWSDTQTRAPRRWFAWGLTACAAGQLTWNLQSAFGSNEFPAYSDYLFLCFGPCCIWALLLTVRQQHPRALGSALFLDAITLAVVVLAIVLVLYLPVRPGNYATFIMLVLYPISMLTSSCLALVIWPTLRLRPRPGWLVMFCASAANGVLWLQWIYLTQHDVLAANPWLYLLFSLATLALGVGAALWRVESSSDPRWAHRSDNLLRMMPLIVVVGAAVSVGLAWSLPNVPPAVATAIYVSAALVLVLATLRQSLLLVDRERMLASEQRTHELERTFKALFTIPHGGLALLDRHGRFLQSNPGCSVLLGYDRDTLHSMHITELRMKDLLQFSDALLSGPQFVGGSGAFETELQRRDGEQLQLEITIALIPDSDGKIFVVFRDITERKKAAEARARLESQLRQSQKLEAIGTLASGIAHDFNNILSAILGNIELALQDLEPQHAALTSLHEVRKSANRARELIRRIVAFGKPQELNFHAAQLDAVVDDSMKLLRAALPATVQIRTRFGLHLPAVRVDSSQIAQVLLNLCTNAYQAMSQQKGLIDIALEQCEFRFNAALPSRDLSPGHYACLRVSDNGYGIDAAIVDRIFEPFFTTKPVGQGSGLGLSIVHNIIRSHGGAITVESAPGLGTHFRIYLPLVASDDPVRRSESVAIAPAVRGRGQHIVYVDDEQALVLLTVKTLERLGYRVSGYTDADIALRAILATDSGVDVIITDQSMPGMSGMELAQAVLEQQADAQLILVSGYMPPDEIERARALGFRAVILKPDTIDQLAAAIHRVLTPQAIAHTESDVLAMPAAIQSNLAHESANP